MVSQNFLEKLSYDVIGCVLEVHRELGPGLLESVYHTCLLKELSFQKLVAVDRPYVPIIYKNDFLRGKLQIDILVENE